MRKLALTALTALATSALISLIPLSQALSKHHRGGGYSSTSYRSTNNTVRLQCGVPVILNDFLFSYSQCATGNSSQGGKISIKNTLTKSRTLGIRGQVVLEQGKMVVYAGGGLSKSNNVNTNIYFNLSPEETINVNKRGGYGTYYSLELNPEENIQGLRLSQTLTLQCGKPLAKPGDLIVASPSCKLGQPIFLIQNQPSSSTTKYLLYEGTINSKIKFKTYGIFAGTSRVELNLSVLSLGKNIPGKTYKVMVYTPMV